MSPGAADAAAGSTGSPEAASSSIRSLLLDTWNVALAEKRDHHAARHEHHTALAAKAQWKPITSGFEPRAAGHDSGALLRDLGAFLLAAMRRLEIPATLDGWPSAV